MKKWTFATMAFLCGVWAGGTAHAMPAEQLLAKKDTGILMNPKHYMRVARIVVDSTRMREYYAALRESMETSVRKEPGVLNLWAVAEKDYPNHITVFEIYADEDAYRTHIRTEHFSTYKRTVQDMVIALELVDVEPVELASKGKP